MTDLATLGLDREDTVAARHVDPASQLRGETKLGIPEFYRDAGGQADAASVVGIEDLLAV